MHKTTQNRGKFSGYFNLIYYRFNCSKTFHLL